MSGMFQRPSATANMAAQFAARQQPAPVAAPAPEPTPVARMPTVDDEEVRRARQANMEQQLSRGGRRSTILTSAASRGGSAGGDSYSSSRFGA